MLEQRLSSWKIDFFFLLLGEGHCLLIQILCGAICRKLHHMHYSHNNILTSTSLCWWTYIFVLRSLYKALFTVLSCMNVLVKASCIWGKRKSDRQQLCSEVTLLIIILMDWWWLLAVFTVTVLGEMSSPWKGRTATHTHKLCFTSSIIIKRNYGKGKKRQV